MRKQGNAYGNVVKMVYNKVYRRKKHPYLNVACVENKKIENIFFLEMKPHA